MERDFVVGYLVVRDFVVGYLVVGLCLGWGVMDRHVVVGDIVEWHLLVRDLLVRFVLVWTQLGPSPDAVKWVRRS